MNVRYYSVVQGTDPELFISHEGRILGSEKLIPKEGLSHGQQSLYNPTLGRYELIPNPPTIHRDGIQVEVHPVPAACRATLGNHLRNEIQALHAHLQNQDAKLQVDFTPVIDVSEEEWESLSPDSKVLGCTPSKNVYEGDSEINVDDTFRMRSAGGHIHIACGLLIQRWPGENFAERLVKLLDRVVGNTSVLIDRHPRQAERRTLYGKAGEYRLPLHGVEYRTLSNFWLYHYRLFSLMFGLSRLTVGILYRTLQGEFAPTGEIKFGFPEMAFRKSAYDAEADILSRISDDDVRAAINNNDVDRAWKNWAALRSFFAEHVPDQDSGLHQGNLDEFEWFAKTVQDKGLTHFFGANPIQNWLSMGDGHGIGWESFTPILRQQMAEKSKAA